MEQTKRKHPNFFDVILIVLLLLLAAGAYFLSHRSSANAQETTRRSYQVELTALQEGMENGIEPGDKLTDTVRNLDMGTITAVEVQPYMTTATDTEAGVMRDVRQEGYITLLLTVEVDTTETEKEIQTVSGYTLRVGTGVHCQVDNLVGSGYILKMDR